MFLHEPGEDNESFTRQDLSSMNVISTQQPSSEQSPPQPPPPQVAPVAAAHYAIRQEAMDTPQSPLDGHSRPALPSTASWASKAPQMSRQQSSAGRSASGAYPSPIVSTVTPRKEQPKPEFVVEPVAASTPTRAPAPPVAPAAAAALAPALSAPAPAESAPLPPADAAAKPAQLPAPRQKKQIQPSALLVDLFRTFAQSDFKFDFSTNGFSEEEIVTMQNFPALFDANGGAKRRALRQQEEEDRRRLEEAQLAMQVAVAAEQPEENEEARGSLQLGGEPEDLPDAGQSQMVQPPNQTINDTFTDMLNPGANRRLTPQQHQQLLLQQLKSPSVQNQPSLPNQAQAAAGNPPGHARNVSRYTFANDSASASASVKPVGNSKLMSQQSAMMPPNSLPQQPPAGFYSTNVQGPPPGLKTSGTPPFSGGGMFGQGHGFATNGLGYGANLTGRSPNDEMMRDLLRTRNLGGGGSQVSSDAGKREYMFPSFLHQSHPSSQASTPAPQLAHAHAAPGLLNLPYGLHQSQLDGAAAGLGQNVGGVRPKKKGKKHRHANTSSSGGGALSAVDVSDPSILQARLHQAQAGPHGGLAFAGQGGGQGGLQSMMYGGAGFGGGRW